jgi:glycosyltransferase involved in cell wall biosynthesis
VLVLGNHFHHKDLNRTANALATELPNYSIVAMGPDPNGARRASGPLDPVVLIDAANLRVVQVGALAETDVGAEYEAADIVVFPSHAEGFGFPLLHALAARRPVFVRRLPVFAEIRAATGYDPNVHFYDSTGELVARLRTPPTWQKHDWPAPGNGAERNAAEIRAALVAALDRMEFRRIVRRIHAVQFASGLANESDRPPPSETKAAQAARFLADQVERVALQLLRVPAIYALVRLAFRGLRQARKIVLF